MDSDSVNENKEDEGPITKDEDPAAGDEGLAVGVEGSGTDDDSHGLDDESHGIDDESCGLDDEGHSVESDGLGLGEEEEVVPGGQQQAAPVVGTGFGSTLESEIPKRVSASRQPTLTIWTDPKDGMVYIDVPAYPPPTPPVQTPTSPEWTSGSLPISPSPYVVPSHVSSPMIPLTVPSPVATPPTTETKGFLTELGAQVEMQGGLICDHAGENRDLRLQLAEERLARLELVEINPILEEFTGELAHIAPILSGIVEADPDDDTSSDDDDFEDIEYVSFEEVNDFEQEEKEFDLEDILQIQDVILRERLLKISCLITNIESLKDNPTPIPVTDSDSSDTFLSHSDNSLPRIRVFSDDTNVEICLYFEPDASVIDNFDVLNNDEPFDQGEGENVVFLNDEEDDSFTFTIRTFLPFVTYPKASPLSCSTGSEDTIFDPGIST
ncbi:hypothetical protein Tco_0972900 [Tanacetum coccineum]